MRVLVAWMPLRWPYRTKFRVFTGKAYVHRRQDPAFAQEWEETLQQAMDIVLEPEAIRRAVEGVEKAVYYQGEPVGTVREYSDTLLIFLLKGWKSDRYKERREVFHRGAVALLRQLERIGTMTPDQLQAFLLEVEAYVNRLDGPS
jgi:hypothetical protein